MRVVLKRRVVFWKMRLLDYAKLLRPPIIRAASAELLTAQVLSLRQYIGSSGKGHFTPRKLVVDCVSTGQNWTRFLPMGTIRGGGGDRGGGRITLLDNFTFGGWVEGVKKQVDLLAVQE